MRNLTPQEVATPTAPSAMLSPSTGAPMHLVEGEPTTYTFRGLPFTTSGPIWECPDTKQRYNTPDQVNTVLGRVHQMWREHFGIGRVALQERRLALGLSAAQASALLGFGTNQYGTYEQTDKLPSKSNGLLLRLLMTDHGVAALLDAAGQALKPAARRRLQNYVATRGLATSKRPTITTTGVELPGILLEYSSDLSTQEGKRLVRKNELHSKALQQRLQKQLSDQPVSQAGSYSYAMAA